jgi:serine/threonine-protein kinase HipA
MSLGADRPMSLGVYWDRAEVGRLERVDERSRAYVFAYTGAARQISLSLPLAERFDATKSRPFFEGLLPEGTVREQLAGQLKLAASDTYGLLAELGRDCAGALQIMRGKPDRESPSVDWLSDERLDELIRELPRHPLGVSATDEHLRLSLAGVQQKAVLVRDESGRFGRPLDGMPSSHIVKPEQIDGEYPGLASNECFCMRLAARCGLAAAKVEPVRLADRPCLIVERFDRDLSTSPAGRIHQEDLCQALGLTPDFKYQHEDWRLPSYAALAQLLDDHSPTPGADRLAGALAAVFNFLVGNADAHAKNIALLHTPAGVRLAPMYDIVSTAAYPELSGELAIAIGDELNPLAITSIHWSDLADDFGLNPRAFESARRALAERAIAEAKVLAREAREQGWYEPRIETILSVLAERIERV